MTKRPAKKYIYNPELIIQNFPNRSSIKLTSPIKQYQYGTSDSKLLNSNKTNKYLFRKANRTLQKIETEEWWDYVNFKLNQIFFF